MSDKKLFIEQRPQGDFAVRKPNSDRASDVLRVRVRAYPKRILLELSPGRTGAELELWSLRKEADYFREVFRRELFVTLA